MWKSSLQGLESYEEYRLSVREKIVFYGGSLLVMLIGAYIFYDSILPAVILYLPAILLIRKPYLKKKAKGRKQRFKKQFMNGIVLLGDYLKSGYSVENAIERSIPELQEIWGGDSDIVREWRQMSANIQNAGTPEKVFLDLGKRSGIEEVKTFSELFGIVKRSGGRLSEVVKNTAELLSEQFAVEEQIQTSTASRRFEQKIMNVMPLAIIMYIRLSSPDLLGVLYTTGFGRLIMSGCVLLYGAAIWLSSRILDIRM